MAAKHKKIDLHVPPEIWREILTRVSVKSILRCRSVCKSWYSLVSCPNFISDHSTKNLNKNDNQVLLCFGDYGNVSYSSLDESFMESRKHDDIPKAFLGLYPQIIGSCNGLICLSGSGITGHTFLIWNPTIRKIVELPSRPLFRLTQRTSYCGFGFDSKANDYRVFRVVHGLSNSDSSPDVCEIFDLRKGVWRDICPRMPLKIRYPYIPECYLDGAVQWSVCGVLLSFSLSDECFRETKLPDCKDLSRNNCVPYTRIVTLNGLIYVIMWTRLEDCSVWAMKEYGVAGSWTKVFDINLRRYPNVNTIRVLPGSYLRKNDEVLMVHAHPSSTYALSGKRDLVSYNLEDKNFKILFSIDSGSIFRFCFYEESLVLM